MAELFLTEEQRDAVYDRGGGLLVSAAAGSGKTRVLVERLLSYVTDPEDPRDINEFLVITYTRAAAAELRGRIVDTLAARLSERPRDRHLRRQTTLVYGAQISTIHGFCANLLREHAHLADIPPDFRVLEEADASLLRRRVLDELLERRYADLTAAFSALADTLSAGWDDGKLSDLLLEVHAKLQSHPDPGLWLETQLRAFRAEGVSDAGETPWGRLLLDEAGREAASCRAALSRALEQMAGHPALLRAYAPSFQESARAAGALAGACACGWDAARAALPVPFPRLSALRGFEPAALQARMKRIREHCKQRCGELLSLLDCTGEEALDDLRAVYPVMEELFALVGEFDAAYGAEKRRRGALDFPDLEHLAVRALAADSGGGRGTLADVCAARYREVLVDEYQDTNAVQNAIFDAVSGGGRRLFCVGDVKQSIYRFRLADPSIFLEKYRRFRPKAEAADGENRRVILSRNFRSVPAILSACNFIFENIMSAEFGEVAYTEEQRLRPPPGAEADAGTEAPAVTLSFLDMDKAAAHPDGSRPARAEAEAAYTAEKIRALLNGGAAVTDSESGARRGIRPGDIAILMRSQSGAAGYFSRALADRGIPCRTDTAEDFFAATEISVVLALLAVVDNPMQDVPLISVLRSAAFGFSADRLSQIRAESADCCFYDALCAAAARDAADCEAFLQTLDALREDAADLTVEQLLRRAYAELELPAVFSAMRGGAARAQGLNALLSYARDFEEEGRRGLYDFLYHVNKLRENGQAPSAQTPAAGEDAVRLMTIHKSKGLEFPVVFLAGTARSFNRTDLQRPLLMHPRLGVGPRRLDADRLLEYPTLPRLAVARQLDAELRAEELRLLYVAVTRARERLFLLCACAHAGTLLRRLGGLWSAPADPRVLSGCSSAAEWLLLAALGRPECGALRLMAEMETPDPPPDAGPPWEIELIAPVPAPETVETPDAPDAPNTPDAPETPETPGCAPVPETADTAQTPAWGASAGGDAALPLSPEELEARIFYNYPHDAGTRLPSKLTATQLKGRTMDDEAARDAPPPAPRAPVFDRPRFAAGVRGLTPAERGTAHHLAMQYLDFSRTHTREELEEELHRLAAQGFLTPEQAEAVNRDRLLRLFSSPLGETLRGAEGLRREFKFSVLLPAREFFPDGGTDEVLLQGVVDCFWPEDGGLTILDFKTDRLSPGEERERAEAYRAQLDAYCRALGEITGLPVRRRLLYFFSTGALCTL